MNQAESFLYFDPSKLGLENLAILHTRSVRFVIANPIGLVMANRWFARFMNQAEMFIHFYDSLEDGQWYSGQSFNLKLRCLYISTIQGLYSTDIPTIVSISS